MTASRNSIFPVLFALAVALVAASTASAAPVVERIGVDQFKQLTDSGKAILLDVRTVGETKKGQIPGSSSIDLFDPAFQSKAGRMQKDKPLLVYCATGNRSAKAASVLSGLGFRKIYDLAGGIRAWQSKGYAVTAAAPGGVDAGIKAMSPVDFRKLIDQPGPVLADFHTTWCLPCREMAPVVDRLATSFGKRATIVRVDTDASRELADAYRIEGVPVFILFEKGKEVWRKNGVIAEAELRKRIEERIPKG